MLDPLKHPEQLNVLASHPSEAESGQTIGFGHHPEGEAAFVEVGYLRKRHFGAALEKAVDLVAEDVDSAWPGHGDE